MERQELEKIIKDNQCIEGGTKEACIKIREVLNNKMNPGNQLHAPLSCVSIEEFIDSVKVLLAFAIEQPDVKISQYYCENNCVYVYSTICPGEVNCGISKSGIKLCPYYTTEDK